MWHSPDAAGVGRDETDITRTLWGGSPRIDAVSYTRLCDTAHSHPKFLAAGLEAQGLWCRGLSYCGAHLTDGRLQRGPAVMLAGGADVLDRLAPILERDRLWEAHPSGDGWQYHDYLAHNETRAEVEKRKAKRSKGKAEAGRKGAKVRWDREKERREALPSDAIGLPSALQSGPPDAKRADGDEFRSDPAQVLDGSQPCGLPSPPDGPRRGEERRGCEGGSPATTASGTPTATPGTERDRFIAVHVAPDLRPAVLSAFAAIDNGQLPPLDARQALRRAVEACPALEQFSKAAHAAGKNRPDAPR